MNGKVKKHCSVISVLLLCMLGFGNSKPNGVNNLDQLDSFAQKLPAEEESLQVSILSQ